MNPYDISIGLPTPGWGVVYGLVASDEPLQIRYVGQTRNVPVARLIAHCMRSDNPYVQRWVKQVWGRRAEVKMRILGHYPEQELLSAENKWIQFWKQYCELLNSRTNNLEQRIKIISAVTEVTEGVEEIKISGVSKQSEDAGQFDTLLYLCNPDEKLQGLLRRLSEIRLPAGTEMAKNDQIA